MIFVGQLLVEDEAEVLDGGRGGQWVVMGPGARSEVEGQVGEVRRHMRLFARWREVDQLVLLMFDDKSEAVQLFLHLFVYDA